jgi:septum site-determining protein MinD
VLRNVRRSRLGGRGVFRKHLPSYFLDESPQVSLAGSVGKKSGSGQKRGRSIQITPKKARVIGIFSCKGGVGKTTTAVNLGTFLAEKFGDDVVVIDANLSAPNLGLHLGILNPPVTIHDVLAGRAPIEKAVQKCEGGLHAVLGSIAFSNEVHLVDLKSCIEPLKRNYKVILLDSSPGFGPEVISAMRASHEILVVTNPEVPTIASTLRTFRAAERFKIPISGVVLNRVAGKRYEIPTSEVRKKLSWPIVATVPDDDKVRESLTAGTPVARYAPKAPASKEFKKLAEWARGELLG